METRRARRKRWAASVLSSDLTPLNKVRKLVAMGYEEDDAEALVVSLQVGTNQMTYYEQIPGPEYDNK